MKTILAVTGGGHVHFGSGIKRLIEGSRERGWNILGSLYGWEGAENGNITDLGHLLGTELDKMGYVGASPIFCARYKPKHDPLTRVLRRFGVTHVVAFGGEDTLSVDPGIPLIGWPKTMDNNHGPQSEELDLSPGTYFSIGYPTTVKRSGEQTAAGHANAQTNGTVHVILPFGRSQDFVAVGAASYGCADFMAPGEGDFYFEEFYERLQEARLRNGDTYHCKPFAVVVIPEGVNRGDAAGLFEGLAPPELLNYARRYIKLDDFDHPKLMPELTYLMLVEALYRRSKDEPGDRRIKKVTGKILSYSLRDGLGVRIDQKMGTETADKCLQLIEDGKHGVMATVRWDPDRGDFTTGTVPIQYAVKERYVKGTGFFDYETTWRPTEKYVRHAERFMGGRPPTRDELVFAADQYRPAVPVD